MRTALLCLLAASCLNREEPPHARDAAEEPDAPDARPVDVGTPDAGEPGCLAARGVPEWGARIDGDQLVVRVRSRAATRISVEIYREPRFAAPVASFVLEQQGEVFTAGIPLAEIDADPIYYGLRAWGPNWPYDPAWTPGSTAGFVAHVDAAGNRFNPNKLLIDPYALELSHDPIDAEHSDGSVYLTNLGSHTVDSGPYAPKGIVLRPHDLPCWERPRRPLAESIIYEVHVRGLTMQDPSVPEAWRGTYRGAAEKAEYLASLGVTAIELLPIHETQNDHNDLTPNDAVGDNYWGYASWSFFAPDRRYAFDRSPGGPTRELREMVRAFHRAGIEVYVDVVYNHTAERGIVSWRGLDNASYYQLSVDGQSYANHNGVGPNLNAKNPIARDLVLDSLRYLRDELGIDGYRFDLAALLGNGCDRGCFSFEPQDPDGILARAAALEGVELIAEPWGVVAGTYQLGNFPAGWAEWNDRFRDTIRRDQNGLGTEPVTPGDLARRLLGSADVFGGRGPAASINYVACHDGFNLRDLYSYRSKVNNRAWPYGPSQGGDDHNNSSDHGGVPSAQRQAARTGLALVMVSAGVPMITGGDELYRTQFGNNNPYNLDSPAIWIDWSEAERHQEFVAFARFMIQLRRSHPELSSSTAEVLDDLGAPATAAYLADPTRHFLGLRRGETYVAYNGWSGTVRAYLPDPGAGKVWRRAVDTGAWMEPASNHQLLDAAEPIERRIYDVAAQSLAVFVRDDG